MTINSLSFVFTNEIPEIKQVNTVYFINNASDKKIIVVNNDVENFASFDVKPELDTLLDKEFIALGLTKEQARAAIGAAYSGHSHNQASHLDNGLLVKEDKTKIDDLTSLTETEATNPDSLKIGLVSGQQINLAIDEVNRNYVAKTLQEIGTIYTGPVKPDFGTWIETGGFYLKSAFPELYKKLGSLLEDRYHIFNQFPSVASSLQFTYGNSNNHQCAANDIFGVYLNGANINIVNDPNNITTKTSATIGFSKTDNAKGVFTKNQNCVIVGSFKNPDVTEFLWSTDGLTWSLNSVPYYCDKFFVFDDLFIGFNATGYFLTTDFVNVTYYTNSSVNFNFNNRGFKVNDLYYFYNDVSKEILVSSDFINFTPTSGLTVANLLSENLSYGGGFYYTKSNTSGTSWRVSSNGIDFITETLPSLITNGGTGAAVISWFKTNFVYFRAGCDVYFSSSGFEWKRTTQLGATTNTKLQVGFNSGPAIIIADDALYCSTVSNNAVTFNGFIWEPNNFPLAKINLDYQKVLDGYSQISTTNATFIKNKRLDFISSQLSFSTSVPALKLMFVVGGVAFLSPISTAGLIRHRVVSYDTSTQFYVPLSLEQNPINYKSWILAKSIVN